MFLHDPSPVLSPVLPVLRAMAPGDHSCGIFRSDAEQQRLVVDFIRLGVQRNERIIYLVNLQTAGQLRWTLASSGLEADSLIARGQLVILTAKDTYLKEGMFEPKKMMALLRNETERALHDGYSALRTSGEMTWALGGEPGSDRLLEYEAMLNDYVRAGARCYGICQYDQRRFDPGLLLDVLHTHPKVILGHQGHDNASMYFVPPVEFLSAHRADAVLEARLHNLAASR